MRPVLDGVGFKRISKAQSVLLTCEFSVEKIEAATRDYDSNKSPGPNGFNFMFIKKFWLILRDDICRLVAEFHMFGKIAKGCNASFITLPEDRKSL